MPSWLVSAPFASPRQELLQWAVQQVGQNCKQFGCHETTLEVGTTSTRATQSTLYQKDLIKKRMQTIPGEGEEHVNGYICSVYIYMHVCIIYVCLVHIGDIYQKFIKFDLFMFAAFSTLGQPICRLEAFKAAATNGAVEEVVGVITSDVVWPICHRRFDHDEAELGAWCLTMLYLKIRM